MRLLHEHRMYIEGQGIDGMVTVPANTEAEIVEIRLTVKASIDVPLGENITTATPIEFEVSGCMVH